ncbi:MAG: 2-oxoacid:acceptor oxidoreductase family protein [Bacteroidota bacterium]
MLEIRGHARGGQGMVTAFEILAKIYSRLGDYQVQAFPFFGVERTGAPIMAFFRIAKGDIFNRSNIYQPHLVVVFDENLIGQVPVFDGLRKSGTILLNTEREPAEFKDNAEFVYTVPATRISLDKGLGSKSLPIVNAAMMGAIIRILDADIEIAKQVISENVPAKPKENAEAAQIAFNSVVELENKPGSNNLTEAISASLLEVAATDGRGDGYPVEEKLELLAKIPKVPFWDKPMSVNKTGNWRVLSPEYVTKQAPCTGNCPAGTDVRLFIKQASEKQFDEAFNTIYQYNPFPSTCGRVCPHFCQQNCNRIEFDENLNIGAIERFLGDHGISENVKPFKVKHNEKIAVIGSGPAGLTAALRLTELGFKTTVFEALPKAGGMMRVGIPEFRLPEYVLDKEIRMIERQGVEIILNKKVNIREIEKDYSAIIVAAGSHIGSRMRIPNEDMALEGLEFLHDFKINGNKHGIKKGDKVAIIGGGNTAIDVARTILRLGGVSKIYYRRTENEMPAIPHEIEEARAEGIEIEFLTAPVGLERQGNGQLEVTMIKMELGEPDESGRRRPVPVKGSETAIEVDKMIKSVGQWYDDFVFEGKEIETRQGKIEYQSGTPVFCSGDMAWGGTVTEAIGSGNEAAREVVAYLEGEMYTPKAKDKVIVSAKDINYVYYIRTPRHNNPKTEITGLYGDFNEVIQGLTGKETIDEAQRCLHCGECYNCGNCFNYCPDASINVDEENRLRIDYDYCKGCGICFIECPCSAIKLTMGEEELVT